MPVVKVERVHDGLVALITLNRPESKNAINKEMASVLAKALDSLRADTTLRVIVITGAGSAFCAGVDLRDPIFADPEMMAPEALKGPKSFLWQIRSAKVPTIAAVNGPCVTGGMEIALQCDIILASTAAVFRDSHSTYGILPAGGMSQILPRMVGIQRARYMSMTGANVGGALAAEWGLACRVVEPEKLMDTAMELAVEVTRKDPVTLAAFQSLINEGQGMSLPAALDFEIDQAMDAYIAMGSKAGKTHSKLSEAFKSQQSTRSRSKL